MVEFDAIILAAGLSRRMHAKNKLLLDWGGQSMIHSVVQTYVTALGPHVTVVTGFEADRIKAALVDLPVTFCHNPDFQSGQQSSVVLALQQKSNASATLIGLGDQPILTPSDLTQLLDAHRAADQNKISIPVHDLRRGNPLVLPASLRPRLLDDDAHPGCRSFTRAHPELIQNLPLSGRGFYTDIDTPEAYTVHVPKRKGATSEIVH